MLNPNVDELLSLFNHYKITIHEIDVGDIVHLNRYGIIIPYSQTELCTKPPRQVLRDIISKVIKHPDYKRKTEEYTKSLIKRPIPVVVVETIEDKKKQIREKLIKDGILKTTFTN